MDKTCAQKAEQYQLARRNLVEAMAEITPSRVEFHKACIFASLILDNNCLEAIKRESGIESYYKIYMNL